MPIWTETISGHLLMKRWGVDAQKLAEYILDCDLDPVDGKGSIIYGGQGCGLETGMVDIERIVSQMEFTRFSVEFIEQNSDIYTENIKKFEEEFNWTAPPGSPQPTKRVEPITENSEPGKQATQHDPEASMLTNEEKRTLGQLEREKEKWDISIEAAVTIGIYVASANGRVMRKEIQDEVYKVDGDIPKTTIERIWKAIPVKYRKQGGRPKNKEEEA